LTPAHANEPDVWYAGTSPQGLFRSEDGGVTWNEVYDLEGDPRFRGFIGDEQGGTPNGPKMHSIIVDPRDPKHLYFGMSSGGVHETRDGGAHWAPLVDGMEVVEGFDPKNLTFHDPHCVRMCPSNPDRLYQQNHCGIYRIDRPGTVWKRIGKTMPKKIGDVGFGIVVHPRDDNRAWVLPMDGQTVWPRTSVEGKPCVYETQDGGKSWIRQDKGLPRDQAWWTVKRQAFAGDGRNPVGLYFGTTSGELWSSASEGRSWSLIARNLPEIYAVESAEIG
jgi:photosystem II stability/assembly factor-like uncharacterized protein